MKGKGDTVKTLEFRDGALWLLDQTKLPLEAVQVVCRDDREVADAIREMKVRGAPAIGLAAAYGVVLAARSLASSRLATDELIARLEEAMERLRRTRPTAVNLSWALARMREIILANADAGPPALAGIPGSCVARAWKSPRCTAAACALSASSTCPRTSARTTM